VGPTGKIIWLSGTWPSHDFYKVFGQIMILGNDGPGFTIRRCRAAKFTQGWECDRKGGCTLPCNLPERDCYP
jgi:hypothetical protein